jgi:uncharacterized protein (TIGR02246 family)
MGGATGTGRLTMRIWFMAAAAMMMTTGAMAAAPSAADRTALERLAADNDAAWNAKDVDGVMAQYAGDGSLRLGGGPAFNGLAAVRRYFTQAFAQRQGRLRHVTRLDNVDLVTPDLAYADAHVRVERDNGDGSFTLMREFRNHSLVVREGGAWRMRAVRAHMLPPKPAA